MALTDLTTLTNQHVTSVIEIETLTTSAYLLHMERHGMVFRPGQCLLLGLPGQKEQREYSIYSATADTRLSVLVKEVDEGTVSRQLRRLDSGAPVTIEGPIGYFTLEDEDLAGRPLLFVATGTGIAPFHAMITSHTALNYRLLHGVRDASEAYERNAYRPERYTLCTSREASGDFHGRVTEFLQDYSIQPGTLCYLCGNVKMIDDAHAILEQQGLSPDDIRAEVYF
ncbi:MAG: oxidoreductase [Lentisphaerae bacterium]|nr:oxidoreductase [Lentisphaerota bacterium]